jgi:hypothetical protein
MESEGAVAHEGEHRARRAVRAARHGERQGRADRARDAVDHAVGCRQACLRPLSELAAIAREPDSGCPSRIGWRIAGPARRAGSPIGRAPRDRRADFLEPGARLAALALEGIEGFGLDQLAVLGQRRAEPQREVQPLADEEHLVGALEHLGEPAEGRIVHAPRALHADHGHAGGLLDRGHPAPPG